MVPPSPRVSAGEQKPAREPGARGGRVGARDAPLLDDHDLLVPHLDREHEGDVPSSVRRHARGWDRLAQLHLEAHVRVVALQQPEEARLLHGVTRPVGHAVSAPSSPRHHLQARPSYYMPCSADEPDQRWEQKPGSGRSAVGGSSASESLHALANHFRPCTHSYWYTRRFALRVTLSEP